MSEIKETKTSNSKDGLALIIGGLFILGLVFATYTYFNKGSNLNTGTEKSGLGKIKDIISSSTKRSAETGENDVVVDVDKLTKKTGETGTTGANGVVSGAQTQLLGTGGPIEESVWMAIDYKAGDIQKGSYTVKSGDTLWEIAEAVYGTGAEWTQILSANAGSVGFLPNGQQALIVPGQVLTLP